MHPKGEQFVISDVHFVPTNIVESSHVAKLLVFEDNGAVIYMIQKGRSQSQFALAVRAYSSLTLH